MKTTISDKVINLKAKLLSEQILGDNLLYDEVSDGICTESFLREILKEGQFPDKLLMDCLMQRAGLWTENYESIVSREEYEIVKMTDEIVLLAEGGDYENAHLMIKVLGKKCQGKNIVYEQLVGIILGVCRLMEDGYEKRKLAYVTFVKTIKLTMSNYKGVESIIGRPIDCMELILHIMIFYLEANDYKRKEYRREAIKKIKMEISIFDKMREDMYNREMARVLVYYGEYIADLALFHDLYEEAEYVINASLKMLSNTSRIYNAINLLDMYEISVKDDSKRKAAHWIRGKLKDMFEYYGVSYSDYRWCIPYTVGEIFSIDYVVKTRRKAMDLSQEELAADVCTARTISNIETGKYKPKPNVKAKILRRLGVNFCDYGQIESYEVRHHNILVEYSKAVNNSDYITAHKLLNRLRSEIPDTNINRQFLEFETILENIVKRKKRSSSVMCDCINAIERTCKVWDKNTDWVYTGQEINILYNIAELQFRRGNNIKGDRLFKKLLEFYEKQELCLNHFTRGYTMIKSTYSSWIGSLGRVEESIDIGNKNMDVVLKTGGGASLARQLYDIGWNYEQLEKEDENKLNERNGIRYMEYAYAVALLNNPSLLKHIEKNVQTYYSMDINPIC